MKHIIMGLVSLVIILVTAYILADANDERHS